MVEKKSCKLQCSLTPEIKDSLLEFSRQLGYPSYKVRSSELSQFINEGCYLYFEAPDYFKQISSPPYDMANKVRNNIQYDSLKYRAIVFDRIKKLADTKCNDLTYEFAIFIWKLYHLVKDNNVLPFPDFAKELYPIEFLETVIPLLRKEKALIEFYRLTRLLQEKGKLFDISVEELCKILFIQYSTGEEHDHYKNIKRALKKVTINTGGKFRIILRYPNVKVKVLYFPYMFEN